MTQRPSEPALRLGAELLDYSAYGLTRRDAIRELAEMADEVNREPIDAVRALLQDAQCHGGVPAAVHVAHLRRVFADYEPGSGPLDSQPELAGWGLPVQPNLL